MLPSFPSSRCLSPLPVHTHTHCLACNELIRAWAAATSSHPQKLAGWSFNTIMCMCVLTRGLCVLLSWLIWLQSRIKPTRGLYSSNRRENYSEFTALCFIKAGFSDLAIFIFFFCCAHFIPLCPLLMFCTKTLIKVQKCTPGVFLSLTNSSEWSKLTCSFDVVQKTWICWI